MDSKASNRINEIITSGRISKAVWYLAWPTAINTLILTAYNLINRFFLGRLPHADEALAAVGIGGTVLNMQFSITMGLSAGTAALVSRFLGAKQLGDAKEAARQSLILSIIASMFTGLPLILFASAFVELVGAKGGVIPIASKYTSLISWFSAPLFLYLIAQTALRSTGDMKSPLYAGAVIIFFNALFDWLLIFGIGPFPKMGVQGAAISTGISRVVGVAVTFWFLRKSILGDSLTKWHLSIEWFKRILNIGWPAAMQNFLMVSAYAGFTKILAYLPPAQVTAAQAALTVGIAVESIAFMPASAYGTAATTIIGQNLGAGKPKRAERSAWTAAGQAVLIVAGAIMLFIFAPVWLARFFTTQQDVVPLIAGYLRINGFAEPFLVMNIVFRGVLQGAGDTRAAAWITLISNWIIRLPLAWFLAITLKYGATGSWCAMSFTSFLAGSLMILWFVHGSWRDIRI